MEVGDLHPARIERRGRRVLAPMPMIVRVDVRRVALVGMLVDVGGPGRILRQPAHHVGPAACAAMTKAAIATPASAAKTIAALDGRAISAWASVPAKPRASIAA